MLPTRSINKYIASIFFLSTVVFLSINCSEKETFISNENIKQSTIFNSDIHYNDSVSNSDNDQKDMLDRVKLVFIGTYTSKLYVYKLDTATGALSYVSESPANSNPSYLAVHPNKKWFYAVNENSSGTISAFSFDTVHNSIGFFNSVSAGGSAPCYISIDNSGKYVMVANYNSGSVTVCPINTDGSLATSSSSDQHVGSGPFAGRQEGPHAHMIIQASNNFIYSTDLGTDKIMIYKFDTTNGQISSAGIDESSVAGAGPRHIILHPTQPWMYAVGELSGTIESFTVDNASGELTRFDTISTLPEGVTDAAASADIHISPNGKYLYSSNRGSNNNIAIYSIDQFSGHLTLLGHQPAGGSAPRNFVIDPSGKFLLVACQNSNKIVTFQIDPSSGLLISTDKELTVANPVCLKIIEIYQGQVTTGIPVFTK